MVLRRGGLLLAVVLGVAAAAVAGVVVFTSGRASGVNLTSASLVPADAAVYVAINTDLKSPQWVAAFDLIERLGEEDPEGQLRESAEEEGELDWEEDVQPFLGGNASIYVSAFDPFSFMVSGAVIMKVNDGERVLEIIEEESGVPFAEGTYKGTTFRSSQDGVIWAAVIDGHLVVAMTEESLYDVIDVAVGESASLADEAEFVALRDELENNFLGFSYFDMERLLSEVAGGEELAHAFDEANADLVLEPVAGVFGAEDDGFVFQAAGGGEPGIAAAMLEPRVSRYATLVPGETAVFVSTFGLADAIEQALDEASEELDETLQANTPWSSVDELLEDLGREAGVESIRDVIGLFDGETAVAVWFPDGDEDAPEGLVMTEVSDPDEARTVIDELLANEPETTFEMLGTVPFWTDGEGAAVAIDGNDLYIGTEEGVRRMLDGGDGLPGNAVYDRGIATLPTATGTYAFVDMGVVLRLASGGIPAELDEAEEALEAFIINMVVERGLARVNGALTVAPE